ncbi:PhoX family phosphatase [Variovorax sp. PCZ-1]|uniref:PhoX family protein n=1 Tax=Variovorax sp. PCZ-1 TaxID=2835533 RepID=UPI001BCE28DC|nr:PhoX family phosphatase [Variovorax sp. PCZ-1]MBS7807050.1 PhoX family phosphatase [Variovorax sp. PCZ-1]
MSKDFTQMEDSNLSSNPSIHNISSPERRMFLGTAGALALSTLLPACAQTSTLTPVAQATTLSFKPIPIGTTDKMVVPEGYRAHALAPWGEPVGIAGNMPAFKMDGSNSAADQAVQMGMHHDGLHYYSLDGSKRGLLVMNHEYVDDGLLHVGGMKDWSAEKVRKSQAAHGISVIEVRDDGKDWSMVRPSRYARRITANTPFSIGGPCRGHAMMRTAADPRGETILGTINNCASGRTPWGTYLSGEENFRFYFGNFDAKDQHQQRWGLVKESFFGWEQHDSRFDISKNPNEPNRFGWVVEVDPMDPTSTPIKRTALGRAAHEGAWVAVTKSGKAVVYSGEDARNEYIYKFVSRDAIKPAGNGLTQAQANRELLDNGTLYVAKFNADGKGTWLPMVHGQAGLTAANGFADQGEVCIKARQASDLLGATKMDRPEWLAIDPKSGWVYCTLTNNSARGATGQPAVDAANPRANNAHGHIIRWKEAGDFDNANFEWNHLLLAGDPAAARAEAKGNIKGDLFGCADGIMFDPAGRLWIQTDMHASQMYKGEFANLGNNQMLAYDAATGQCKRFFTGPTNSEVTGGTWTPDGKTLFLNIQHPGETAGDRSDPAEPTKFSNWPDYTQGGRPRSSTVVVRKIDGGVIGT